MASLKPKDLNWIGTRFLDPIGRVFAHEGEYYRAIYPHQVRYVNQLLGLDVIKRLMIEGLLVETQVTKLEVEGYGMVLQHQPIPYITYAEVWNRKLYRDAALCGINLNLALLDQGLGTIDFHTNNILQGPNCQPVWIDFGSIAPLSTFDANGPVTEMTNNFLHPLFLMSQRTHLTHIARFLAYQLGGITADQFRDMTGATLEFEDKGNPRASYLAAREWLQALEFPKLSTMWDEYQAVDYVHDLDRESMRISYDKRTAVIHKVLETCQPRRVVDLSCNAGRFSFLAATMGADTYAVDLDEEAVDRMYDYARQFPDPLTVTAAVHDVMKPPRAVGDLVLGLALTHHLSLSQHHRFENIAERFAAYTTDVLLTEFMPYGLGSTKPHPDPLPAGYNLQEFIAAHRPHFGKLEVIYCPSTLAGSFRILMLCTERRTSSGADTQIKLSLVKRDKATESFIYRFICPSCQKLFVNNPGEAIKCPHCQTEPNFSTFDV